MAKDRYKNKHRFIKHKNNYSLLSVGFLLLFFFFLVVVEMVSFVLRIIITFIATQQ